MSTTLISTPGARWRRAGASLAVAVPTLLTATLSIPVITGNTFRIDGERYFVLFDDAMISMRFARNLVDGHGLRWNAGQAPVEGYTNFLWTLWMAVLHLPGLPDSKTPALVIASGAAILVLNLLVVRSVARRLAPNLPAVATLALFLTSLCVPLVYWTMSGVEVGLLSLLVSLAMLYTLRLVASVHCRDVFLLVTALATAVLVRTDQIVLCAVILGFLGWRLRPGQRMPTLLTVGLAVTATLAAHTAFRLVYYGDPLPNPYYLKVHGVPTSVRLTRGLLAFGASGLASLYAPLAFAGMAMLRSTREARRDILLPITVFVAYGAYSVFVGGDAWEWFPVTNRFVTVGLPALLLVSALGIWNVSTADPYGRRRMLLGLTVGFGLVNAAGQWLVALSKDGLIPSVAGGNVSIWKPVNVAWWPLILAGPVLLLGSAAVLAVALRGRAGHLTTAWATAVTCGAALLVAANASAALWLLGPRGRPSHMSESAALTRLALTIRDATMPEASVAVVWAGLIPYFSHRAAVDLLGRSDRVIANKAHGAGPYWPGHDRWDYGHSIGRLRPDVIAQLWRPTAEDLTAITGFGYERLLPSLFVRGDSIAVDRAALESAVCALLPDRRLLGDFGLYNPLARKDPVPRWDWNRVWRERCVPSS